MRITVLLFASIAEALGRRRLDLDVAPGARVADAREQLVAAHPDLARFVPTLVYAVDEEYVRDDAPLHAGATLALIPPVSGG